MKINGVDSKINFKICSCGLLVPPKSQLSFDLNSGESGTFVNKSDKYMYFEATTKLPKSKKKKAT